MGVIGRTHRFAPTEARYIHLFFLCALFVRPVLLSNRCVCPNYSCFLLLGVVLGYSLFLSVFFINFLSLKKLQKRPALGKSSRRCICSGIVKQYPSVCNGLSLVIDALFLALRNSLGVALLKNNITAHLALHVLAVPKNRATPSCIL